MTVFYGENGEIGSENTPDSQYEPVIPNTFGSVLFKALCESSNAE